MRAYRVGLNRVRGITRSGLVHGVNRVTLIFDIGDVSVMVIGVISHNLGTTIGKCHSVFSGNNS